MRILVLFLVLFEDNNYCKANRIHTLLVSELSRVDRKKGSVKTLEQRAEEYSDIITYLKKGYSIRITAKLSEKSISTVQRVKKDFQL